MLCCNPGDLPDYATTIAETGGGILEIRPLLELQRATTVPGRDWFAASLRNGSNDARSIPLLAFRATLGGRAAGGTMLYGKTGNQFLQLFGPDIERLNNIAYGRKIGVSEASIGLEIRAFRPFVPRINEDESLLRSKVSTYVPCGSC